MPLLSTTIVPREVLAVRSDTSADAELLADDELLVPEADDELVPEPDELLELEPQPARTSAATDDTARIQDLRTTAPFVVGAGPEAPLHQEARRRDADGSRTQRTRRAATESIT